MTKNKSRKNNASDNDDLVFKLIGIDEHDLEVLASKRIVYIDM